MSTHVLRGGVATTLPLRAARRALARVGHLRSALRTSTRAMLVVHQFPALSDNYGYLLHDEATGATACVDTPEAAAVDRALREKGWKLTTILNTHHHSDHVGGNLELKTRHNATVIGPSADAQRIPGLDIPAKGGDVLSLGESSFRVIHTPGHTTGHCAYYFEAAKAAFVGDTLFSLGCGRMFEGTPPQFLASLRALAALPDDTRVYCAHEYTAANGRFAVTLEPGNAALAARVAEVAKLRAAGKPTVPSTIGLEKATNPFLRQQSPELRAALGMSAAAADVDVFAAARKRKDTF